MKKGFRWESLRCWAAAVVVVAALLTSTSRPAYAYIDPNTGGYAFQILFPLLSAVAGVFLFFKKQAAALIRKIAQLFRKDKKS